ncbi:MAG: hypothetical protein MUP10_04455 [Methanoregulaceae archaeon]|nr:hypothetical protein [Methanoregulaceae archaeon]
MESIRPEAWSPAVVVGYLHNHGRKYDEDAGSQPFPSAGVLGVEENNVSDGNSGDEPGEQQGNFPETEEQVREDDRDDGEDVAGGNRDQGVAVVPA